jgi:AcrB/AcrD/AcrF family protein
LRGQKPHRLSASYLLAGNAEREQDLDPEQSTHQAALLRFRPIMMTIMAALFRGIQLAIGPGTGAELRQPLGVAMPGGLLVSQFLTLYTTPVVHLWLDRLKHRSPLAIVPIFDEHVPKVRSKFNDDAIAAHEFMP